MKLNERYDLENMKNRAEEMVFGALNHVTPRYYTSLLGPLTPRPEAARKAQVEIDLAIASGLKKLKSHRHHGWRPEGRGW